MADIEAYLDSRKHVGVFLLFGALTFIFTGAGAWSIDHRLGQGR